MLQSHTSRRKSRISSRNATTVTAVIQGPNAYCQTPPYYSYSFSVSFVVVVQGSSFYLGQFTYKPSNGLPISTANLNNMLWTIGTPRVLSYSSDARKVANSGASSVVVELFNWEWDPYTSGAPLPALTYLGVIATLSNTGLVNLTLNVPNFQWTQALSVLSLTSGLLSSVRCS